MGRPGRTGARDPRPGAAQARRPAGLGAAAATLALFAGWPPQHRLSSRAVIALVALLGRGLVSALWSISHEDSLRRVGRLMPILAAAAILVVTVWRGLTPGRSMPSRRRFADGGLPRAHAHLLRHSQSQLWRLAEPVARHPGSDAALRGEPHDGSAGGRRFQRTRISGPRPRNMSMKVAAADGSSRSRVRRRFQATRTTVSSSPGMGVTTSPSQRPP